MSHVAGRHRDDVARSQPFQSVSSLTLALWAPGEPLKPEARHRRDLYSPESAYRLGYGIVVKWQDISRFAGRTRSS